MAVTFKRAATQFDNLGGTPIAADFGAGNAAAQGDLLIAFLTGDQTDTFNTLSGWTLDQTASVASSGKMVGYHKVAGASEPTSYSWSSTGGTLDTLSILMYSGEDQTTPLDVTPSTNTAAATTTPTLTGVADVTAGSLLVGAIHTPTATAITVPASMAERSSVISTKPSRVKTSDEASDTATNRVGTFAASVEGQMILYRIRPAAAGGVAVHPSSLRPTVVGPTARAFHMLQRIPSVPIVVPSVPFALMDWPNMWAKPNPIDTRTVADASEFWMLKDTFFGAAGQPPANQDWPNPTLGEAPSVDLRTWLLTTVRFLGADRFFGAAGQTPANLDWPVPKGRPYPLSTWLVSLNQLAGKDTFFGAPGQPPASLDWPNPMRAAIPNIDLRSWLQSLKQNLLGLDTFFSGPGIGPDYDWPNPRGATLSIDLRTHIWNPLITLLTVIVQAPFAFFDWIAPLGRTPNPSLKTHIDPLKTNLQGQDQFFGPAGLGPLYDWPNPQIPTQPIANRSWHLPNWITTLGSIIPAVVSGAEIILILPLGKLAKRITSKIYELLD